MCTLLKMRIDILTLFPTFFDGPFGCSIPKRALNKNLVEIHLHDIRKFSKDKHNKVDDYPFGGGSGMVMTVQPIASALDFLLEQRSYDEVIFLTPDGETLNQQKVNAFSLQKNIILLCGHYKGIDQRIRDKYITREISIGDYVLSGGEFAAAVLTDAICRIIPGVISDETSALNDSFQDGLLDHPTYSRPASWEGREVPPVLLSGNQAKIDEWRFEQSLEKTKERRPDLLK